MVAFFKSYCYIAFWFGILFSFIISWWDNVVKLFKVSFNCGILIILFSCYCILIPFFKFIACISCCLWLRNCYFFSWIYIINCNFFICNLSASFWVNYKSYCLVAIWLFIFCAIWICLWNDIFQTIKGTCDCCIVLINCRSSSILIPCSKFKACFSLCSWWVDCYILCWVYIEFFNASNWTLGFVTSFYNKGYFLVACWLFIRSSIFFFLWNNIVKFCCLCCYYNISFFDFSFIFLVPFFEFIASFFFVFWFYKFIISKSDTCIFLYIIGFFFCEL